MIFRPVSIHRITPAHAGKRYLLFMLLALPWDHPRTCGEKNAIELELIRRGGSPPHMRGKVSSCSYGVVDCGITPAHAGKRSAWNCQLTHTSESPPHMRGKALTVCRRFSSLGITPAHAGKSRLSMALRKLYWDHPRTCGEKLLGAEHFTGKEGSPPHMRGKVIRYTNFVHVDGITPAHAGKSLLC